MSTEKTYSVYIMTNRPRGVLYTGITSDLPGRVQQHRLGVLEGFTKKYNCKRLVWFETYDDVGLAIQREKRVKRWRRVWKIDLVERSNPQWFDLWTSINGRVDGQALFEPDCPPEVPDTAPTLRPGTIRDDNSE